MSRLATEKEEMKQRHDQTVAQSEEEKTEMKNHMMEVQSVNILENNNDLSKPYLSWLNFDITKTIIIK